MIKKYKISLAFLVLLTNLAFAQTRQVAITIDDLPFVGEQKNVHLNMIIDVLKAQDVPATGFVIASNVHPENLPVLFKFREAGLGLGNHTWSHKGAKQIPMNSYLQDIEKADRILKPVLSEPKYFRFPYLDMGEGDTRKAIQQFLTSQNYHIAPVTIDSKDFIFNQLLLSVPESNRRAYMNVLKPCYLEFLWQQTLTAEEQNLKENKPDNSQILLIHANLLNAYVLEDIIFLFRSHGYHFVSLDTALKRHERA